MVFVPDAPINLLNDPFTTSDSTIRFTWSDGPSDGDKSVLDYRIIYDQSTNEFITLEEGVTQKSYTT
jgi:hypothetical protein